MLLSPSLSLALVIRTPRRNVIRGDAEDCCLGEYSTDQADDAFSHMQPQPAAWEGSLAWRQKHRAESWGPAPLPLTVRESYWVLLPQPCSVVGRGMRGL